MGNEREFSRRVRAALKQAGCACYPVETGGTASGFPDLVALHKGGASFIELKCRPSTLVRHLAERGLEGPGQRAFGKLMARRTAFMHGGCSVSERSFLLAECMDGVALMVEEDGGAYLAACWEGLPSGEDLRDALRAWRVAVVPSKEAEHGYVKDAMRDCAAVYEACTGIHPMLGGQSADGIFREVGGKEEAVRIARNICDRGRYALLMERGGGILDKEV